VIQKLNAAVQKVMNTPEVRAKIEQNGLLVKTNSPAEYAAFLDNERKMLGAALAKKPLPESK
jgi:tripartite-type tricarboxylate transporter receptor subunit TctC